MKTISMVLSVVMTMAAVPSLSLASAMSPEKSRCYSMEGTAKTQVQWSAAVDGFLADSSFSGGSFFNGAQNGVKKGQALLKEMYRAAGTSGNTYLLWEIEGLLKEIQERKFTVTHANRILKTLLLKIQEEMSDSRFRIQSDFPNCAIEEKTVIYTQSSGVGATTRATK